MLLLIKTYRLLLMMLLVLFIKQTAHSQDISVLLNPIDSQNVCLGDSLKLDFSVIYIGDVPDLTDGVLNYYVSDGQSEEIDTIYTEEIVWDLPLMIEGDTLVQRLACIVIDSTFESGLNYISVSFTGALEVEENFENNVATDTINVICYTDFEGVLDPLPSEQDTLTCDLDSLYLNGGARYNGNDTITIDTLYLTYGLSDDDNNSNIIHRDTLLDRTIFPGDTLYSPFTFEPDSLGIPLDPGTNVVVVWPTVSRMFFDTDVENDFATDSTYFGCTGVDFGGVLDPLAPDQDTLTCASDSLYLNGGVRYIGDDSITIDTLYLNYSFGDTSQIIYRATFIDQTFYPGDTLYSPHLTFPVNEGTNVVVVWPTVSRMFFDTDVENDFATDSTYLLACAEGVDFEGVLDPLAPDQDTLTCDWESLYLNGGARYNGNDTITIDTLYLTYGLGNDANDVLHRDTLLDRTFFPGDTLYSPYTLDLLTFPLNPGTNVVVVWPTVSRMFFDTVPDNDFAIDSTYFTCTDVDFSTELEFLDFEQDSICIGDTLMIEASIQYHGEEPITLDTFYLKYFLGTEWTEYIDTLMPELVDTLLNRTFMPNEVVERVRPIPIVAPTFIQGSTGYISVWHGITETYKDVNTPNNVKIDSFDVRCILNLPLNLISFTGEYTNEQVELDWQVSLWDEGSYFDIERSENGFDFELIDKINAVANEQTNTYRYIDNNPYLTTTYYRLKMVDINGATKYSPVIAVKRDNQNTLSINHIHVDDNQLDLTYSSTNHTPLTLSLYDVMGRLIYREVITDVQFGFNQWKIDVTGLNSEIYVLSLQSDNELISRMFSR